MLERKRKNIRLEGSNYLGQRKYFITLCCARRHSLLNPSKIAVWAIERLRQSAVRHSFSIHAYCVMPNHLHILAEGATASSNLLPFVMSYKQVTGFEFQRGTGQHLWQFKYFDHILRRADAFESVAWYIWLNPVRKGMCQAPHDYLYSGSMTDVGRKLFLRFPREIWSPPWRKP